MVGGSVITKRKILAIVFGIISITSCSSINTNKEEKKYNLSVDNNFENIILKDNLDEKYSSYLTSNYYDDEDFQGKGSFNVIENGEVVSKDLTFGKSILDYKNNYENLLSNAENLQFKKDEEGNLSIVGGFNTDLTYKLKTYTERVDGQNIEFITEIVDTDKESVGIHNISRKIKLGDKVLFEKREKAFVNYPGTNVGIIDATFFDLSDGVEEKTYRVKPKEFDHKENFYEGKTEISLQMARQNLERSHGTVSISSMIDQIYLGQGAYSNLQALQLLVKVAQKDTQYLKDNFKVNTHYEFNEKLLKPFMQLVVLNMQPIERTFTSESRNSISRDLSNKLQRISLINMALENNKENEDGVNLEDLSLFGIMKINAIQDYKEIEELVTKELNKSIDEKVKDLDINFHVISAGSDATQINNNEALKNLATYLDENKSLKVVNMSYGNDLNVEEYKKLKAMTLDDKQRVVEFYNKTPEYRAAILASLRDLELKLENKLYEKKGVLADTSTLYSYFEGRDKIDVEDFDKLITARLGLYELLPSLSPELKLANKDILFVRANGNTWDGAQVDLTDFDSEGNKIIYQNPNYKYSNGFSSLPLYLDIKDKEKAEKENKEYVYNSTYRKNILSVVGVAPKTLPFGGEATETISGTWGLFTIGLNTKKLKSFGVGTNVEYSELLNKLEEIKKNPNKYTDAYKNDIIYRIKVIDDIAASNTSDKEKEQPLSFSRAGEAKLWAIAAEGMEIYKKKLTDEEKKYSKEEEKNDEYASKVNVGSSFAAPRVSVVAAKVSNIFPWMSAHQIKQVLLTTADDGYLTEQDLPVNIVKNYYASDEDKIVETRSLYGVDDIIGWGVLRDDYAYLGPARFNKALAIENNENSFTANIPYGTYKFGLKIYGAFDKGLYLLDRGLLEKAEAVANYYTQDLTEEEILSGEYKKIEIKGASKTLGEFLSDNNIDENNILNVIRPKIKEEISKLPKMEKDLFEEVSLVKKGNGTLILGGNNLYKADTIIEEGSLVIGNTSNSTIIVNKNGKLKLNSDNLFNPEVELNKNVENYGKLYNYTDEAKINKEYNVYEGAKTNLGFGTHLTINKLNLKSNKFELSLFPILGKTLFKDGSNTKEIIKVKNIDEESLTKINEIKDKKLSLMVKIKTEETEENGVKGVNVSLEKVDSDTELDGLRNNLETMISEEENQDLRNAYINDLNTLELTQDEDLLNGDMLVNSLTLGFDITESKSRILYDILNNNEKYGLSVFSNVLADFRIKQNQNKKLLSNIYGNITGIINKNKYNTFGAAFDYNNSTLNNLTLDQYGERKIADVSIDGFGLTLLNEFYYKNFYLDTLFGFEYLTKNIKNLKSSDPVELANKADLIVDINNQFGYKYKHKFNEKLNLTINPYVGLDLLTYIKVAEKSNTDLSYSSNKETIFKSYMTIGSKFDLNIDKNLKLSIFTDFSKYLTSNSLEINGQVEKYKFSTKLKGVYLKDYSVGYGMNIIYKPINNLSLNLSYKGRNIDVHRVNLGIKYSF